MNRPQKRRLKRAEEKHDGLPPFRIRAVKIQPMLEFYDANGRMEGQRLGPEMAIFEADAQFGTVVEFLESKGLHPMKDEAVKAKEA
jgi:hypothetical protein